MKQHFKYILIFICLLSGFIFKAGAQNIQVLAKLDQDSIKIGDQTKLRLIVHQPSKEHVIFPALKDTLTSKVQIIGAGKLDTVFDPQDHERATVTQTYTITAFDEGSYTITAFSFKNKDSVLTSNDVNLLVRTVKVDTTKAIYDIKQPLGVEYNLWDWLRDHLVGVLIGLGIALLIVGVVWYIKSRPKKEAVVEEEKVQLTLTEEMLNKLRELRDRKLWQNGAIKEYYIELSDIIREYLERRYVVKTHEKTTDEIFQGIKYMDISDGDRSLLRQILVLADLVKFAKEKPVAAENEQVMDYAIRFVNNTQQVIIKPKEQAEGGNIDGRV